MSWTRGDSTRIQVNLGPNGTYLDRSDDFANGDQMIYKYDAYGNVSERWLRKKMADSSGNLVQWETMRFSYPDGTASGSYEIKRYSYGIDNYGMHPARRRREAESTVAELRAAENWSDRRYGEIHAPYSNLLNDIGAVAHDFRDPMGTTTWVIYHDGEIVGTFQAHFPEKGDSIFKQFFTEWDETRPVDGEASVATAPSRLLDVESGSYHPSSVASESYVHISMLNSLPHRDLWPVFRMMLESEIARRVALGTMEVPRKILFYAPQEHLARYGDQEVNGKPGWGFHLMSQDGRVFESRDPSAGSGPDAPRLIAMWMSHEELEKMPQRLRTRSAQQMLSDVGVTREEGRRMRIFDRSLPTTVAEPSFASVAPRSAATTPESPSTARPIPTAKHGWLRAFAHRLKAAARNSTSQHERLDELSVRAITP